MVEFSIDAILPWVPILALVGAIGIFLWGFKEDKSFALIMGWDTIMLGVGLILGIGRFLKDGENNLPTIAILVSAGALMITVGSMLVDCRNELPEGEE